MDFLMDNVSNLSSARNITNILGSLHEKINHTTVGMYKQYLCNAFTFLKSEGMILRAKNIFKNK